MDCSVLSWGRADRASIIYFCTVLFVLLMSVSVSYKCLDKHKGSIEAVGQRAGPLPRPVLWVMGE